MPRSSTVSCSSNADVEADADDDGWADRHPGPLPVGPGPRGVRRHVDDRRSGSDGGEPDRRRLLWRRDVRALDAEHPYAGQGRQRWASPIDGVIVRWRVRLLNFAQALAGSQPWARTGCARFGRPATPSSPSSDPPRSSRFLTIRRSRPTPCTRSPRAFRCLPATGSEWTCPSQKASPVPGGLPRFDTRGGTHRLTAPAPADGGSFSTTGGLFTQSPQFNADVEPDADRDGFGDVTQDACPTNATTQGRVRS